MRVPVAVRRRLARDRSGTVAALRRRATDREIFAAFPEVMSTPEWKVTITEEAKFAIMDRSTASDAVAGAYLESIHGRSGRPGTGPRRMRATRESPPDQEKRTCP